jgi:tellurite resistance protein
MEIDKTQAVAIAAFNRFDEDVHDPVLRAVSAAYCLVACADGELEARELAEYVRVAQSDARFERLDRSKLEHALKAFGEALQTDVTAGRARALDMARDAASGDAGVRDLLLDAAKLAMQANDKVSRDEVSALRALCEALGVSPRQHLPED